MGLSQFDEYEPTTQIRKITVGDDIAFNPFISSLGYRVRIDSLTLSNDDVIDHVLTIQLAPMDSDTGNLASVTVPAGAGLAGVPPVELLGTALPTMPVIVLGRGDAVNVAVSPIMGATATLTAVARGGRV